jgi:hypothetical protein
MFASLKQTISLWFTEKTGLTVNFLIFLCIAVFAALVAFIFLCVTGYAWAAVELGPVFGGLATAGVFLTIAACCWAAATLSRARARQRAILERAARSRRAPALMDPQMLKIAMQAGRYIGWQRLIPIASLGFLATQLVRERRREQPREVPPDEII